MARLSAALALLLLAGCASPPLPPSALLAVEQWGGSTAQSGPPPHRITRITVHHQGEVFKPEHDPVAYLRRLQQWSRLSKRWADIPYHYVIAPDGRVFMARPEQIPGDTNTGYDTRGHALVMLLGNFEAQQPSPAQLDSAVQLMAWLADRHGLGAERIASHRDYSETLCPGANLYPQLPALRAAVAERLAGRR
jgi:hypothetical protein